MTEFEVVEEFRAKLHHWKERVNQRLNHFHVSQQPAILYDPIRYVLEGGGKRIRPILLLMSSRAVGGDWQFCTDAAVAVELLHNFTLVHDDIMDQDDTRRGRPTVHNKWDSDVALLAGDGLVALAYKSLLNSTAPRIADVARTFTDGIVELCEGQALDRDFESRQNVSLDEYMTMIEKKTATLLSVSAKIGAILGGGTSTQVMCLAEFGANLGRAFQIQDDLLDITSTEEVLGKTHGSDVKRRKQTYLLVYALANGSTTERQEIESFISKPHIEGHEIDQIRALFDKTGAIQAAKKAVNQYLGAAEENLSELPKSDAKEELYQLLSYISNRDS